MPRKATFFRGCRLQTCLTVRLSLLERVKRLRGFAFLLLVRVFAFVPEQLACHIQDLAAVRRCLLLELALRTHVVTLFGRERRRVPGMAQSPRRKKKASRRGRLLCA